MNNLLERNEQELPDLEIYENLSFMGVRCSECGNILSQEEIFMHRFVGITKPVEMSCQGCWMAQAYG
jgi:ribosomal protein S27E